MRKVMLSLMLVLAMASIVNAQTSTAPVPVVVKPADIPKPSKRDLGVHILVSCSFQVVGDGVSNQITINITNWPSYCGLHPAPFSNPDTSDLVAPNVNFYNSSGAVVSYSVPISYDNAGNFTFTFPLTPPAGVQTTLAFNIYYNH